MKFHYIVVFVYFVALNWDLLVADDEPAPDAPAGDAPPDESAPPVEALSTTPKPGSKFESKWKFSKPNFTMSEESKKRWANISANSKEFNSKIAKFGGQFNKFNLCMGKDFIKKCKIPLLMCAIVPFPPLCLLNLACGGANLKKCYGVAYGKSNSTKLTTTLAPGHHDGGGGGDHGPTEAPPSDDMGAQAEARRRR